MPLDAYHLYSITRELDQLTAGGRIDKINMPSRDDVLLLMRAGGKNLRLMISADPAKPRLWLTTLEYVNPPNAPAFCMHLRKYLSGGRILSVSSVPTERVVRIEVLAHSELGDERTLTLIVEIMGRCSNILLVDERGRISDCLKHTPLGVETERPMLAGLPYRASSQTDKFDYTDSAALCALVERYPGGDLSAHLLSGLAGFASFSLKAILRDCSVSVPPKKEETDAVVAAIARAYRDLETKNYTPKVIEKNGCAVEFTVLNVEGREVPTLLDAECAYYSGLDARTAWTSAVSAPTQAINAAVKKLTKRIAGLDEKITESAGADQYRIYGEILTANLFRVPPRSRELRAENWYDSTEAVIPLNDTLTASQNASAYFKRYNKLKRAASVASGLRADAERELDYILSVRASLTTSATYDDIEGIKAELAAAGLLRLPQTKGKRPPIKNKPLKFDFSGYEIWVGKNNLQNEELTFKFASGTDLWAHVLHAHGSHVIVKTQKNAVLPDNVIVRACELAAYYSDARSSARVEVDYCQKKYVLRNPLKGLGNVNYSHRHTLVVSPRKPE